MRKILSFGLLILALNTKAQQLTTYEHVPLPGDVHSTYSCDSTNVHPGNAGAGTLWDFSTLSVNTNSAITYSSTTNSNPTYPGAWVQTTSTNGFSSYYSFTSNNLFYHGGNIPLNIGGTPVTATFNYTSPAVYANYPLTLNTTTTSNTAGSYTASIINGTFTGICNLLADGTGTLSLPSRTFTNVLRVVTSQTITSNTGFGSMVVNLDNYEYYETNSNVKYPLLTISVLKTVGPGANSNYDKMVSVLNGYSMVGLKEIEKKQVNISLFPNPASDNISFYTTSTLAKNVQIFDITGKFVNEFPFENNLAAADINSLNAGIYYYSVIDKNKQVLNRGKFTVGK